ncbi:MAG: hypothetical protein WAL02_09920 [Rhodoplanes sp.]
MKPLFATKVSQSALIRCLKIRATAKSGDSADHESAGSKSLERLAPIDGVLLIPILTDIPPEAVHAKAYGA